MFIYSVSNTLELTNYVRVTTYILCEVVHSCIQLLLGCDHDPQASLLKFSPALSQLAIRVQLDFPEHLFQLGQYLRQVLFFA